MWLIYLLCIRKITDITLFEISSQLKKPNYKKLKFKTIEGYAISITE